jgi:hypothetical protein
VISITVQGQREDEFARRLKRLDELVRKGLIDPQLGTLPTQAQLATEHCMVLTPPGNNYKGKGGRGNGGKNAGMGRKEEGEAATSRDLQRLFQVIEPSTFRDKRLAHIVEIGDAAAWDSFAQSKNAGGFANKYAAIPSTELHDAKRDNRGRVRKGAKPMVVLKPQHSAFHTLWRYRMSKVGHAKAGWLAAYLSLGGTRAPDWVTRHGTKNGTIVNNTANANGAFISVWNYTRWGTRNDEAGRVVSDTLKARAAAMRRYFEVMMKLAEDGKETPWQAQVAAAQGEGI